MIDMLLTKRERQFWHKYIRANQKHSDEFRPLQTKQYEGIRQVIIKDHFDYSDHYYLVEAHTRKQALNILRRYNITLYTAPVYSAYDCTGEWFIPYIHVRVVSRYFVLVHISWACDV